MSKEGTFIHLHDDDGDDDNDDDDAGVHSFAVSPHKSVAFSPLPPSPRSRPSVRKPQFSGNIS